MMGGDTRKPSLLVDLPAAKSAVGNLADLEDGQVLLPAFAEMRSDGLYIDPKAFVEPGELIQFVDRVYSGGNILAGLDAAALHALMFPRTPPGAVAPAPTSGPLRIAADIRPFVAERRGLYKNVKLVSQAAAAEYVFEPVYLERRSEEPIYGETDADGNPVQTGTETRTWQEPATLDIDEFVASMWQKGVRFGLDLDAVRKAIAGKDVQRLEIAHRMEPADGKDATVDEQSDLLHRDDAPSLLPNGRIDLRKFRNRFPQVTADTRLLKKVPRRFGLLGFAIDGKTLEPPVPRDFDLDTAAGPGTRIERDASGEYIVAARDGFLTLDDATFEISIMDKIVNRDGVSLRSTGDLSLAGDHYEEMGEVQEKRTVEGKHMTFHADVFGNIVSSGGRVVLEANLSGGSISDPQGAVTVNGRCSQASIEARGGAVELGLAEGCTVVAGRVRIARAVACQIVADDVTIDESIGSAIAGRRIAIARSSARKDSETAVWVCVPDFSDLELRGAEIRREKDEMLRQVTLRQAGCDALAGNPEIAKFLAGEAALKSGKLKLTDAQQAQWTRAAAKLAPALQKLRMAQAELDALKARADGCDEELAELADRREAEAQAASCGIADVVGETTVRGMPVKPGASLFLGVPLDDLKQRLRDTRVAGTRLFSGDRGELAWQLAEKRD